MSTHGKARGNQVAYINQVITALKDKEMLPKHKVEILYDALSLVEMEASSAKHAKPSGVGALCQKLKEELKRDCGPIDSAADRPRQKRLQAFTDELTQPKVQLDNSKPSGLRK